jgi:hypothetical protein
LTLKSTLAPKTSTTSTKKVFSTAPVSKPKPAPLPARKKSPRS